LIFRHLSPIDVAIVALCFPVSTVFDDDTEIKKDSGSDCLQAFEYSISVARESSFLAVRLRLELNRNVLSIPVPARGFEATRAQLTGSEHLCHKSWPRVVSTFERTQGPQGNKADSDSDTSQSMELVPVHERKYSRKSIKTDEIKSRHHKITRSQDHKKRHETKGAEGLNSKSSSRGSWPGNRNIRSSIS
jgi:hypothetical protein